MQWSGSAVVWTVIIVVMMTVLAMEGVVVKRLPGWYVVQ